MSFCKRNPCWNHCGTKCTATWGIQTPHPKPLSRWERGFPPNERELPRKDRGWPRSISLPALTTFNAPRIRKDEERRHRTSRERRGRRTRKNGSHGHPPAADFPAGPTTSPGSACWTPAAARGTFSSPPSRCWCRCAWSSRASPPVTQWMRCCEKTCMAWSWTHVASRLRRLHSRSQPGPIRAQKAIDVFPS